MKKHLTALTLLLTAALAFAAPDSLRIISYNIRDGFDTKYSTISKDKQVHYDNFVRFMNERKPDILCMQELCTTKGFRFNDAKVKDLAAKYGHPYTAFLPIGYGIGISSKYPIEVVTKHAGKGFGHGFLHVRIRGLNVITTHLHPAGYTHRRPEADLLLKYIADNKLTHCLVMGDFNARSPFDDEVLAKRKLRADYHSGPLATLSDRNDYSVVSKFIAYPMIDTLRLFVKPEDRMTCPVHFPNFAQIGERIDYIFVTADLAPYLKDGRIHNRDSFITKNSDHAPQELDLDPKILK